ncbi:MAG: CapA family protein [Ruminococcaceae bacterium]|nr:CapA family protein [Oscillospiraceae bacterium]
MIVFLGDVALITKQLSSQFKPKYPYVFNLEYVIGEKETYIPRKNKINLCSENADFEKVFGANPIAVGVANNHILDYERQGYENTVSTVTQKGVQIIQTMPCYVSENVCMMAYMDLETSTDFSIHKESFAKVIEEERTKNPNVRIVIQMHWGIENQPKQSARQKALAHWMIDQGVDLIIGHHPHCIQPIEKYKGKYIFYSLGNALFADINQPSHYDENGNPKRIYRFKWQKWNRKSLAVTYDETNNTITAVEELYQSANELRLSKKIQLHGIVKKYTGNLSNVRYLFRKYWLFFVSNSFVDGKLFDFGAIRSELKENG